MLLELWVTVIFTKIIHRKGQLISFNIYEKEKYSINCFVKVKQTQITSIMNIMLKPKWRREAKILIQRPNFRFI